MNPWGLSKESLEAIGFTTCMFLSALLITLLLFILAGAFSWALKQLRGR